MAVRLSNEQWKLIEPFFPKERIVGPQGGRPGYSTREILQAVLWILRTGARWGDELPLPRSSPSGSTCYRHFKKWVDMGIFDKVIRTLVEDLRSRGKIDLTETFIDATFVRAKKGAQKSATPVAARVLKSWQSLTVDLFHSPCLLKVLHQMRVDLLCQRYGPAIHGTYLIELLETKRTILMHSGLSLDDEESNSFLPTAEIERSELKMAELYDATDEDGWLSDSSPGFNPSDE